MSFLGLPMGAVAPPDGELWGVRKGDRTAVCWQRLHPLGLELRAMWMATHDGGAHHRRVPGGESASAGIAVRARLGGGGSMKGPSAEAVRMKLDWAHEHQQRLLEELRTWSSPGALPLFELTMRTHDYISFELLPRFKQPELFTRWGLMVGDMLTNYRDALDHAVFLLVTSRGTRAFRERDLREIDFPMVKDESNYGKAEEKRAFDCISDDARRLIRKAQPFEGIGPLWSRHLRKVTNVSKHRVLPIAALYPDVRPAFTLRGIDASTAPHTRIEFIGRPILSAGEPFARITLQEPSPRLTVAPAMSARVVIEIPEANNDVVYVDDLAHEMKRQVEDLVTALLATL